MADSLKQSLVQTLVNAIQGSTDHIAKAADVLINGAGASYAAEVQTIQNLIKPVAMSVLSILFLIDLIGMMTQKGDELRYEDVMKSMIKLLICKNIMSISPVALSAIYTTITNLISGVASTLNLDYLVASMQTQFEGAIPDDLSGLRQIGRALSQIMTFLSLYIPVLLVNLVSMVVTVLCYGRAFELAVLESLSPIPVAFAGWAETKDVPKRFFLSYLGVCLQGLAIVVCFKLYVGIMGTPGSVDDFLLYTVALALGVASSGKWAKDSLGLV